MMLMDNGQFYGSGLGFTAVQQKPFYKQPKFLIPIIGIFVLLAILLGVASNIDRQPTADFVKYTFVQHNAEKSLLLTSESFRNETSVESWGRRLETYKNTYKDPKYLEKRTFSDRENDATIVYYTYRLTSADGKKPYSLVIEYVTDNKTGQSTIQDFQILE